MRAVRCSNGHWYDSEAYEKCPHCGQEQGVKLTNSSNEIKENKKGFSLFQKGKKKRESTITEKVPNEKSKPVSKERVVMSATNDEITEQFFADIDDDKTMSMFEANEMSASKENIIEVERTKEKSFPAKQISNSEPLVEAVQRVSAMDEGKTLSYFNAMTAQKEASSASEKIINTSDPVVGWLVAISGMHLGESFQLYAGKNTIGRSSNNKITIGLDKSISRDNHVTIIYEPKRREFYLQSGNSEGLTYLNDSFVNGSHLIYKNDIVEIGATKLIFIPLCGVDFSWEQYM